MELEHELDGMDMSLGRAPIPWDAGSGYYTAAHEDASHASAFLVPDVVAAHKDHRHGGSAPPEQVLRLLESLQTLGDENAALLA